MQSYLNLQIWHQAKDVYLKVNSLVVHPQFQQHRYFREQLLRSSLSIALNISEGNARGSQKEFVHFLRIARGSLDETHAALAIALQAFPGLPIQESYLRELEHLKRSINALIARMTKTT
jgi:four helix bundle protein